jgi:hypothetical protein
LHGSTKEELYLKQRPGYARSDSTLVCKLNKALYGLKQASTHWHAKLKEVLVALSFKASDADPCLFVLNQDGVLLCSVKHTKACCMYLMPVI